MTYTQENGNLSILYVPEHTNCHHYEDTDNPTVEIKRLKAGESHFTDLNNAKILFVLGGVVKVFLEETSKEIEGERILFLPPGSRIKFVAIEDTTAFFLCLKDNIKLCKEYTLADLNQDAADNSRSEEKLNPLKFNLKIRNYLRDFIGSYNDGLRCIFYIDIKLKELFFILRGYYNKEDLYSFFNPIISQDIDFSLQIWNNYRSAASVGDLAEITNYSVSHFQNKFRETFGESALQWLNNQKARNIFFDLRMTDKPFKQISEEYHFASTSYLSTFCKRSFDLTPRQIREHC